MCLGIGCVSTLGASIAAYFVRQESAPDFQAMSARLQGRSCKDLWKFSLSGLDEIR